MLRPLPAGAMSSHTVGRDFAQTELPSVPMQVSSRVLGIEVVGKAHASLNWPCLPIQAESARQLIPLQDWQVSDTNREGRTGERLPPRERCGVLGAAMAIGRMPRGCASRHVQNSANQCGRLTTWVAFFSCTSAQALCTAEVLGGFLNHVGEDREHATDVSVSHFSSA